MTTQLSAPWMNLEIGATLEDLRDLCPDVTSLRWVKPSGVHALPETLRAVLPGGRRPVSLDATDGLKLTLFKGTLRSATLLAGTEWTARERTQRELDYLLDGVDDAGWSVVPTHTRGANPVLFDELIESRLALNLVGAWRSLDAATELRIRLAIARAPRGVADNAPLDRFRIEVRLGEVQRR